MANIYELGVAPELREVMGVSSANGKKIVFARSGLIIEHGFLGGEYATMVTTDPRFDEGEVESGDIIKVDFRGSSVGSITEVFREGFQIFPLQSEEQLRLIKQLIETRRAIRAQLASSL